MCIIKHEFWVLAQVTKNTIVTDVEYDIRMSYCTYYTNVQCYFKTGHDPNADMAYVNR